MIADTTTMIRPYARTASSESTIEPTQLTSTTGMCCRKACQAF